MLAKSAAKHKTTRIDNYSNYVTMTLNAIDALIGRFTPLFCAGRLAARTIAELADISKRPVVLIIYLE